MALCLLDCSELTACGSDAKYLKDKKKYTPDAAMFDVVGFDVFNSEMERFTCLDWEDSVYRRAKRNAVAEGKACPRYTFPPGSSSSSLVVVVLSSSGVSGWEHWLAGWLAG